MNYSGEGEKSGLALGLGTHVKMLMTTLKRVKIECIASKAVEGELNLKNLVIQQGSSIQDQHSEMGYISLH